MQIFDKIGEGSANIIISPPLEGKKKFIYRYIDKKLKAKEPVLYITTDASPETIKQDMLKEKIFFGASGTKGLIQFIDAYSHHVEGTKKDAPSVKRVSGPLALNEMSIALSKVEADIIKNNPKHTVIFDSISTMLMYSNPQAIARFLQITIAKAKKAGGTILLTLEEGMHKPEDIIAMEHLMNSIIHIKHDKDKILAKASGIDGFGDWSET